MLTLKVVSADGEVLCSASSADEVILVYSSEYKEGDKIILQQEEINHSVFWSYNFV